MRAPVEPPAPEAAADPTLSETERVRGAAFADKLSIRALSRAWQILLKAIPEVQVVQHVLGLFDYRLRVVARDIVDFERVLRRRIMTLPGIGQVEANVLLTEERRPGPLG